jgi:hypothetical protein
MTHYGDPRKAGCHESWRKPPLFLVERIPKSNGHQQCGAGKKVMCFFMPKEKTPRNQGGVDL